MPDLLLELFSEEIPARMQAQAAKDLERLVVGALSDRGLLFEGAKAFAGPRRLTLAVAGLPAKQPDVQEEKKGPRVGAPEKAIEGFLRSAGVTLDQCQKQSDGKGEFYVAVIARKGRATAEVLAEVLPEAFAKLPWPKSMRFPGSEVRWVRPLHSILCTFDGEVVPFSFAGVKSGNATMGHRFLSKGPIEVRRFDDYVKKLRDAHVVLDAAERKEIILNAAKQQAFALGLELIEDEGLLEEVAGLAEWPVVLIGKIEDQFMDVPAEILQTSMRTHQKYFSLRDARGKLANRFAMVSNMVGHGEEIVAGNERVLRARLSDAKFFWDQDRQHTLESRVEALKGIVFHAKLGTQYERVERIEALAGEIAEKIGADVAKAKRAARLCKADLTTGVVGEFPELQGVMGRYYRLHDDPNDIEVADAIRDHYKPVGPSDAVPSAAISVAVALADKIDTLTSFFYIDERPTGSSDPFALRRAGLGVIRIILANDIRIGLARQLVFSLTNLSPQIHSHLAKKFESAFSEVERRVSLEIVSSILKSFRAGFEQGVTESFRERLSAINLIAMEFLKDRLKVALKEKGTRHDLIDAVFSLGNEDDLVRLVARVEALQEFLKMDNGAHLLAASKRATNIVRIEQKKGGTVFEGAVDPSYLREPEARTLLVTLTSAESDVVSCLSAEDYTGAMTVLAGLRDAVDAFFENVRVNDDNSAIRENKLRLLTHFWSTLNLVADFSKIEG